MNGIREIQTTEVGSYPTPRWLAAMPSMPALRDAMMVVLRTQELAGLDVVAESIGVIDIKDNEVERPDVVARRIEHAVSVLGKSRIRWVHPDCGFWMPPRSVADAKVVSLVKGRDRYLGRD